MAKINQSNLKLAIHNQVKKDKTLLNQGRVVIENQFKTVKNNFINNFLNHPVTKELKGGASSKNITNTLRSGNLYGFIGFESGYDPLDGVERLLRKTSILVKNRKFSSYGFIWTFLVTSPSLSELYDLTPMPWANGASWLREIEGRGIPNLGQYLFKQSSASRSGGGIQNSNSPNGGRVRVPYIRDILEDFEDDLNSIEASRVSKQFF